MKIIKRNGLKVDFDESKIYNAINKAVYEILGKNDNSIVISVLDKVTPKCYDNISVEEIQDLVVDALLYLKYKKIAIAYISYRTIQEHKRNLSLEKLFNRMGEIVDFGDNENSNKNYKLPSVKRDTIAGLHGYFARVNKLFPCVPAFLI